MMTRPAETKPDATKPHRPSGEGASDPNAPFPDAEPYVWLHRRTDGAALADGCRYTRRESGKQPGWGYYGAPVRDLAWSILRQWHGEAVADLHHEAYARDVLATLPPEGGVVTRCEVKRWLRDRRGDGDARRAIVFFGAMLLIILIAYAALDFFGSRYGKMGFAGVIATIAIAGLLIGAYLIALDSWLQNHLVATCGYPALTKDQMQELFQATMGIGGSAGSWMRLRALFRRLPMYDELRMTPLWRDDAPVQSIRLALLLLAAQRRR